MSFQAGQQITFTHYGAPRRGVIIHTGIYGNIVYIRDDSGRERWLHRDSVAV